MIVASKGGGFALVNVMLAAGFESRACCLHGVALRSEYVGVFAEVLLVVLWFVV